MTVKVINQGCRLNAYESEVIAAHAKAQGLANTIVVNTCAVTAEAERQARQQIRKLRRENPNARIVATGCAAQIDPEGYGAMAEVDQVVGNQEKLDPLTWSPGSNAMAAKRIHVTDIMQASETASHLLDGFVEHTRAFVQVQQGCDHRCTFCIIPYGRGNSRSVPAGVVVEQVQRLVDNGIKEVVLTGVDLTSWGGDLPLKPGLGNLVKRILKLVPDLERLRLSSIDSIEIDEDLMESLANEMRLMPHLHLSLQSGSDLILKRMKRRHLSDEAVEVCARVKALRSDAVFGADIIAGFPTETDEMFADSMRHVEDCQLTYLHVFPYSPRQGTPAARMPQVDGNVRKERARKLRDLGDERLTQFLDRQQGQTASVLMESKGFGRTPQFAKVALDAAPGSLVMAEIGGRVSGDVLEGRLI